MTNWWASDLPSCRGFYNFDRLHFDYYRDNNTLFEAFKGGKADWRYETVARLWATSYHFPAAEAGAVVKQTLPDRKVITYGLAFNTSKAIFKDIKIRKALTLMYNFPWANKNLFFGEYERSKSYFEGAKKLMALGLPKGEELNVLLPYKNQLPQEVFSQEFSLPSEESPDFWHGIIKQAEVLFNQAGWVIKDFKMVNKVTEEHFNFEFLSPDKSIERIMGNYVESLKRLGINLRITTVDAANYEQRTQSGHYDMVLLGYAQSHTPGNEQRSFWHSATADLPGTRNIAKVKNPVVDNIVEQLIRADNYPSLCAHTRALDRVLLWNYYMIPAWASKTVRIAYWNRFGRPEKIAKYLPFQPHTWWIDKTKEAKIKTYLDENTRKGIFPAIREFFVKNAMKLFSSTAQQPHKNS